MRTPLTLMELRKLREIGIDLKEHLHSFIPFETSKGV
jgi:hypothetical protein